MWVEAENAGAVRCRVLIVEDDPSSRRALTLLLQLKGFQATVAAGVNEAMQQLRQQNPTCVLLDLMLPDGNGATILEYIRAQQLPIRVAVTTGASNWQTMLDQLQPDALFTKPLDFNQLVDWLNDPQ